MPALDAELSDQERRDRLSRWVFWSLWTIIILIAAAFYYEKAADNRSAFVRWRPQVLQFWDGVNIYDEMLFPNPPLMPITLYPLMKLPTVAGAMCWFAIKFAMTSAVLIMCFRIAQPTDRVLPPMFRSLVLLLSLRPILGDLHHGNNNLLILFLIVSMLYAWRRGHDIGAGLLLALATTYKVTPALFFLYFAYKRSWRTVLWGSLGMGIFLLIVPSMVIGPRFNAECLGMWFHRMIMPYVAEGATSSQEVNQSVSAWLARMLIEQAPSLKRYGVKHDLNLVSLSPALVRYVIKVVILGLLGLLAFLCRTKTTNRRDPRLLGEFALVVLTMLFVSERSWKHHYVTVLLPITYLVSEFFSPRVGQRGRMAIAFAWAMSFGLMASTSADIGGHLVSNGHEIAQGYGLFMWAGVVLYATVGWRVWVRRAETPPEALSSTGGGDDHPAPDVAKRIEFAAGRDSSARMSLNEWSDSRRGHAGA
ncbi:MAG: glycosyltransferase family 87 protein [Isosphaeraceae bacterium]